MEVKDGKVSHREQLIETNAADGQGCWVWQWAWNVIAEKLNFGKKRVNKSQWKESWSEMTGSGAGGGVQ